MHLPHEDITAIHTAAASTNLRATVFELLGAAEAGGWIPSLVDAAHRHVPGNPALGVMAAKRRT